MAPNPDNAGEGGDAREGADRRRYHRLPKKSLVTHQVLAFSDEPGSPVAGRMRDLSRTGLRFESDREYTLGSLLKLELELPGWEKEKIDFYRTDPDEALKPLVVLAEVRWVRPEGDRFEIGALFVNIDEWHGKALEKYLEKLEKG